MSKASLHTSHADIVLRLNRANHHLRKTIGMIETGRDCADVARQLHAIKLAVSRATHAFIHQHIEHCLGADARFDQTAMLELRDICRYL